MKMEKVVIFDLDDTLYKEIDYLRSAYKEISDFIESEYDKREIYEFMISCYKAGRNTFAEVIREYNLPISVDYLISIYRSHKPNISLDCDTQFVLEQLSLQKNINLGILTDGRGITQNNKIIALGIDQYIRKDNWVISEEFGYSKPSSEGYLYFQKKYKNAAFYYIGDNLVKDFIAPIQLGWTCICLLDDGSHNIHKQDLSIINNISSLYTVKCLRELFEYL
ncbi:HAD family hydrolase [Jilunia laotingensis]|nr:HAD family hydrolase [Jilunia laotingensis]